jgi:hypothetical protein
MEENRSLSWTDLFIKVIIIAIFVLFTVWLLSLSNKGVTNSLDVLTDNIFAENIDRMKEVGKEYFTTERLPKKIGEIKTITLKEMYEKKLILEVKDKNGNACDADDSYISIEKMENEYQMKVNLECDEEEDHIIVIMGCYDYCDTDICEKREEESKEIEYQYSKTTGGKWTDYGKWSEWNKIAVTANNYRQVETKKVNEEYTYEEVITKTLFDNFEVQCPSGYTLSIDKTKCYKVVSTTDTKEPTCPDRTSEGYTLVGRSGFTCNYSKSTSSSKEPVCPDRTGEGYTLTGRNGFTCNYSKEVPGTNKIPVQTLKTCYRQELVMTCPETGGPCNSEYKNTPYQNPNTCGYETVYVDQPIITIETDTKNASCPNGYTKSGSACTKTSTVTDTKNASCPSGYTQLGTKCSKVTSVTKEDKIIKACLNGYKPTSDGTKCYKDVQETVKKTGTREVVYYRYRVRQYINGTTDYKWSKSKNDKTLLDAGYKLTGKTR